VLRPTTGPCRAGVMRPILEGTGREGIERGRSPTAVKCITLPTRWGRVPRIRGGWGAALSQSHVLGVMSAMISRDSIIAVMAPHPHPA
jgi:hypothetical protein